MISAQLARYPARLVTYVHGDDLACPGQPGDLQTLQSHAPLAEDRDGIGDAQAGRLDRGHAVAQRLQAGRLAVGNPVVYLHQGNGRHGSTLGEATGQIEADNWSVATPVAPSGPTECAGAARELGPRRDAVTWPEAGHA